MRVAFIDERLLREEVLPDLVRHGLPPGLELRDVLLQVLNADLLDLAGHHFAGLVGLLDARELLVVLHEEGEVLEGDVGFGVAAQLALFLGGVLPAGEGEAVDFVLDLVRRVGQEDRRRVDARGHFRAGALERGQEDGVDDGWLLVLHFLRVVAALPEIRVLVDRARDQARDVAHARAGAEDVWEGCREGGCGLDGAEEKFTDVVAVVEPERAFNLVDGDPRRHARHVLVERPAHEREVGEDECFCGIEADRDDVLGVFHRESLAVFDLEFVG